VLLDEGYRLFTEQKGKMGTAIQEKRFYEHGANFLSAGPFTMILFRSPCKLRPALRSVVGKLPLYHQQKG
jgi:hypothetical protein